MAKENIKKLPMLAKRNWWIIRKKFKETIPKAATKSYFASILGVTENPARTNVIPDLKIIGLIDDEDKPTELANRWRDDKDYPKVCDEIKQKVYPRELLDAVTKPATEREAAKNWFKYNCKVGEAAADRMAAFYILISEADPKDGDAYYKPSEKEKKPRPIKKEKKEELPPEMPIVETPQVPTFPSIHIDLQIHISPEAKPEQIDKIFESLYKHYKEYFGLKKIK